MGSWSVYCGISNISIVSGQDCILLPLKKGTGYEGYLPYLPATLPILGKYDDYGGIEKIVEDQNTKLIEDHFGISISEFASFIIDGGCTYNREELNPVKEKMKSLDECKEWPYMWIDRKVYNFLSTNIDPHENGHLHYGSKEMLEFLGFEFVEKQKTNDTYDPKRFNQLWKFGDKEFHSDGKTLLAGKDRYVMYYSDENRNDSITHYINIPEDKKWIGGNSNWKLWKLLNDNDAKENLLWIIGRSHSDDMYSLAKAFARIDGVEYVPPEPKTLLEKYCHNFREYGDLLADLVNIRYNLHCMSGRFDPYVLYLTPQFGEHQQHQVLLDKFAEINKSYIEEYQ